MREGDITEGRREGGNAGGGRMRGSTKELRGEKKSKGEGNEGMLAEGRERVKMRKYD